jgi:RNA polymerase sigma-70 factor (ECF subfamily)
MATATIPANLLPAPGTLSAWAGHIRPLGYGRAQAPLPSLRDGSWLSPSGASTMKTAASAPAQKLPDDPRAAAARVAEQAALAALAARCLAGDAHAWEDLVHSQQRRVYGICYRFTGSQSDAEDLTQDAFLKIYRNLANFDPARGSFVTWMTTLTRNLLVDNFRRSRMDRVSDSLDEPLGDTEDGPTGAERLADTRPSQEKHAAGLELRAQIQAALAQVSPDLREAVILRDLEDMDYKDIADVLGIPQGTVKSRISRGRAELAKLLQRLEGQVM